jgi:hypothetical protein
VRYEAAAAACAAVALAGCGGAGGQQQLPRPLVSGLIAHATAFRTALRRHDGCAARRDALALRKAIAGGIRTGRIPAALGRDLRARSTRLIDSVVCVPPARQPPPVQKPAHVRPPGHAKPHGPPKRAKPPKPPHHHGHKKHR